MNIQLPENSYDLVWACESGEHMPDKKKFVNMVNFSINVYKPNTYNIRVYGLV